MTLLSFASRCAALDMRKERGRRRCFGLLVTVPSVHTDAVAADVDRHGVPSHGEEGNNGTELTSLLYHHQLKDDFRPV
jgi:hypothetical protein